MCSSHYNTRRIRDKAYGRWQPVYIDAEPARTHVHALRAAGMGLRRISELSGVDRSRLVALVNGRDSGSEPSRTIHHTTAEKILAVPIPVVPHHHVSARARIPATGTTRRLQALVAAGWQQSDLCVRIGVIPTNGTSLFTGKKLLVTAERARRVESLFRELQLVPGPCERSRRRAQKLGWALPMQWDEDSIDDPTAQPDTSAGEKVPFEERWAEIVELGLGWRDAIQRWRMTPAALAKRLERAGIPVPGELYLEAVRRRAS
jgi:hypothetical protein